MLQGIQEQSFLDGFAVGEFTGRLQHQTPTQVKEWVPLSLLTDLKGVLRKHNYSITGLTANPDDATQVLMVAEKIADGTNTNLVQAFTHSDRFMDGWEAGCLHSLLRYGQLNELEKWVKITNLDAIQQVLDQHGYIITSMRIHPEDKRWTMVNATRQ